MPAGCYCPLLGPDPLLLEGMVVFPTAHVAHGVFFSGVAAASANRGVSRRRGSFAMASRPAMPGFQYLLCSAACIFWFLSIAFFFRRYGESFLDAVRQCLAGLVGCACVHCVCICPPTTTRRGRVPDSSRAMQSLPANAVFPRDRIAIPLEEVLAFCYVREGQSSGPVWRCPAATLTRLPSSLQLRADRLLTNTIPTGLPHPLRPEVPFRPPYTSPLFSEMALCPPSTEPRPRILTADRPHCRPDRNRCSCATRPTAPRFTSRVATLFARTKEPAPALVDTRRPVHGFCG